MFKERFFIFRKQEAPSPMSAIDSGGFELKINTEALNNAKEKIADKKTAERGDLSDEVTTGKQEKLMNPNKKAEILQKGINDIVVAANKLSQMDTNPPFLAGIELPRLLKRTDLGRGQLLIFDQNNQVNVDNKLMAGIAKESDFKPYEDAISKIITELNARAEGKTQEQVADGRTLRVPTVEKNPFLDEGNSRKILKNALGEARAQALVARKNEANLYGMARTQLPTEADIRNLPKERQEELAKDWEERAAREKARIANAQAQASTAPKEEDNLDWLN